jgi:hypothetical protein
MMRQDPEAVARDEAARIKAAIEQGTGRAIEFARLAAAFFLEAVRAGVPQGEAVSMTDAFIRSEMQDRMLRDNVRERTERGPLDL